MHASTTIKNKQSEHKSYWGVKALTPTLLKFILVGVCEGVAKEGVMG